jgi:hypothetical protein
MKQLRRSRIYSSTLEFGNGRVMGKMFSKISGEEQCIGESKSKDRATRIRYTQAFGTTMAAFSQ